MAEIPVERKEKSSFPWWLIPLALLGLLALFFLMRGCNNPTVVDNTNNTNRINTNTNRIVNGTNTTGTTTNGTTVTNTTASSTAAGVNGNTAVVVNNNVPGDSRVVTAVNYYGTTQDKNTIVGRNVDLATVRVDRVLSDRVFTVKSENEEMFVMLDEGLDSGGGNEQRIKIRAGQDLKLGGNFRTVPTAEVKDEAQNRDLNAKEYQQMKNQKVYLHATSVTEVR